MSKNWKQKFVLRKVATYVDEDERPHNFDELKKTCESCLFFDLIYGGCTLDCFGILKKKTLIIIK